MKVIVKRIPCRKKPAPDAAEQAKADTCFAMHSYQKEFEGRRKYE